MKKFIFFSTIALLAFATLGCEKEEKKEKVILPEAKIAETLPLMSSSGINKKTHGAGEIVIINSQKELNEIFNKGYLPKELTNVDFTKNTVIVGSCGTAQGVSKIEHNFSKVKDKYEYTLTIFYDLTHVAQCVGFGIIIEKIPNNSEVVFKVNIKH